MCKFALKKTLDLLVKPDYMSESKTGRIALWIISVILLAMGLFVVIVDLNRLIVESFVDTSLIQGSLGIVLGVIGIIHLLRRKK